MASGSHANGGVSVELLASLPLEKFPWHWTEWGLVYEEGPTGAMHDLKLLPPDSGTPRTLVANGREVRHARVFADVPPGAAFWYENSSGLVEIAVNQGNAGLVLGLAVGTAVAWR